MSMHIYINGRFLSQPITGVQRYAIELVKSLDRIVENPKFNPKNIFFTLIAPKKTIHSIDLKNISLKRVGCLGGHLWEQMELPFYTHGKLLLNLCNTAPIFKKKKVVTIHDASVYATPNAYSFLFRTWYRFLLRNMAKNLQSIITVSEFSKSELVRFCKFDKTKIKVIYEGSEHVISTVPNKLILERYSLINGKYILAVSSLNPNKNFSAVAQVAELLDDTNLEVVIVGGKNTKIFQDMTIPKKSRVIYVGYISDGELRALYENAMCFLFPSVYEGFGLPAVEAMACGCPAIVSNNASLPEICGDAAIYCNPLNPEDIAKKILLLTKAPELMKKLKEKGTTHSKKYDWQKCAQQTIELIESTRN